MNQKSEAKARTIESSSFSSSLIPSPLRPTRFIADAASPNPKDMTDNRSVEVRRRTMRAVKGKNTSLEMKLRRLLHRAGYRYRLHRKDLPGKPDIAFPSRRKAIFAHGCFWHGHDCPRNALQPKNNATYWREKIAANKRRDREAREKLADRGWGVFVVWECETKASGLEDLRCRLFAFLDGEEGAAGAERSDGADDGDGRSPPASGTSALK